MASHFFLVVHDFGWVSSMRQLLPREVLCTPTQNLSYIYGKGFAYHYTKLFLYYIYPYIPYIGKVLRAPHKIPPIYIGKECAYPHASWYSGFPIYIGRILRTPTQKLSYIYRNWFLNSVKLYTHPAETLRLNTYSHELLRLSRHW